MAEERGRQQSIGHAAKHDANREQSNQAKFTGISQEARRRMLDAGAMLRSVNEHVLIVDDDERITSFLNRILTQEGFATSVAHGGYEGLAAALEHHPDLVLLDLALPGVDGMEVCRRLREGGDEAILVLTARDGVENRVEALNSGADDYLCKPFDTAELIARIRALLRRRTREQPAELRYADVVLDSASREARRGQRDLSLSAKELDVLAVFMRNPRKVLSIEDLSGASLGRHLLPSQRGDRVRRLPA